MLNCKETTELVSRSLDEKLTLRQRIGVRLHMVYCALCRRYEQQLKFLRTATRRLASGDDFGDTEAEATRRVRTMLKNHPGTKNKR